jgi:glycosyltransferase involved in cell wall biosynthesis
MIRGTAEPRDLRSSRGEETAESRFVVVIPAYEAADSIADVVRRTRPFLPQVIVVDDGSTDGTGLRAEEAGARVLSHRSNRGKGAALRTAFQRLREEALEGIITLDADGQHDPADIPRFVETFRRTGADLIVGSRAMAFPQMSRGRRFGNRFSSAALFCFSGLRIADSQSGFRFYSQAFLKGVVLRAEAYDAEMELLLKAAAGGYRVTSLPLTNVIADGRAGSHYRPWLDTYRICACVLRYALRRRLLGRRA